MIEQEIHILCEKYNITNYSINPDGSIDVEGDVNLSYRVLTKIPIKFNKVNGNFNCSKNKLTSLEGCPNYVGGSFYCFENKLTSLEGYNGEYDKLHCNNKEKLIRKTKLKILEKI